MFQKKIHLDMIDADSKMALKLSCLKATDNDVSRARELYDFLTDGIADLPDVTPAVPDGFTKIKQGVGEAFSWLGEHREEISQGVSFIQSFRKPISPDPNIPPIPKL